MIFQNRQDAGEKLGLWLLDKSLPSLDVVLGLPRGGVIVAAKVAEVLNVPFDLVLVRKLGLPGHEELAMGAIGEDLQAVLNDDIIAFYNVSKAQIDREIANQIDEIVRRKKIYASFRADINLKEKTVLVVDDGLATGATMRAAFATLRHLEVKWLGCAVPVGAADSCRLIEAEADGFYCYQVPLFFSGVGQWYADFRQTTDQDVAETMQAARMAS